MKSVPTSSDQAVEFAIAVRDGKVLKPMMDLIQSGLSDSNFEVRKGACMAIAQISAVAGSKVEPFLATMLSTVLNLAADKKIPVRLEAKKAAEAILTNANMYAIRYLLPSVFKALETEKKWFTKHLGLELIQSLVSTAPDQVTACLPDIIPNVAPCMSDTKKEVKLSAQETMSNVCIGNADIEPFIPSLISSIANPDEVQECVHKLASTTFVKAVDAPTLAIMLPLLTRGLTTNKISIQRQTAVIIDNMCKLVENPQEAQLFMPKLLPGLEKVIDANADPECREVAGRAHTTLTAAGEDAALVLEYETILSIVQSHAKKIDAVTMAYVAGMCHALCFTQLFDANKWESCVGPFIPKASAAILAECKKRSRPVKIGADLDDGREVLCDCEFSLAYGGMILLNNTRLRLQRGHIYGLCGQNGCGKSTLMRAIANGQLEGFPSKDELRTVFVEHSLQASEAELNVVEFVMSDEALQADRTEVVETLTSVGFDDELKAKAVGSLSGGWKMKLELARAMLMHADILLLDEPTNHLDVANVKWLETYLTGLTNVTSMIVSHDSGFLDNVCSNIVHYENRKLKIYKGNLSEFVKVKPEAKSYYELEEAAFSFKFPAPGYLDNIKNKGKRILKMSNCTYTYPGQSKPTVIDVSIACALSSRVAVIGPNGAGKSTIIKMLTGETEPSSGEVTKHPNLRFAYVAQHAFHHLEEHLDSTPNQYVQWRFQNGFDKELMAKASRQMTPEEKAQLLKVVNFEGEKRVIAQLLARRKMKKSFEYEIEWKGLPTDENSWVSRERLQKWGFDKLLQITDDAEAARANLLARPVTSGVIQKYFDDFGLASEFSTHSRIRGLSGGQKVKVVLGAAMWQNPHMIVLDEPTNYLDRDSLGALAKAINEFEGGVVMISHNTEFTAAICKESWSVTAGRLHITGETAVDNDKTKIEQKMEEVSIDAFGNEVKTKMKRKLTRKERKARDKMKKAALEAGEDWSSSDDE